MSPSLLLSRTTTSLTLTRSHAPRHVFRASRGLASATPPSLAQVSGGNPTPSPSPSSSQAKSTSTSLFPPIQEPKQKDNEQSPLPKAKSYNYPDGTVRSNWLRSDIQKIYDGPLLETIFRAATIHRMHHNPSTIALNTLINIKQGGCSEDCSYCSQSSHHKNTPTKALPLMQVEPVLEAARRAKEQGSTRFCCGAAWTGVGERPRGFERILGMVEEINKMGLEVCMTLGSLTKEQAVALKSRGLSAYNHNLDSSREFYPKVITTRTYDDRLKTIQHVRDAGISVCSGGILGLGEEAEDRVGLIWETASLPQHPESFPINTLVPIPGTPLENNEPVSIHTLLRTIATARIVMPKSVIRLAAGRNSFTESEQAMAFMAGANSLFTGDGMLTTPTTSWDVDKEMIGRWGLRGKRAFEDRDGRPMDVSEEVVKGMVEKGHAEVGVGKEVGASA